MPAIHTIRVAGAEERSFVCSSDDSVLAGALRAGLGFPHECSSGGCGSCFYDLQDGEVHELWPTAPGLMPEARQAGRRLACQTVPLSDCRIKLRLKPPFVPPLRPVKRRARYLGSEGLTHDMRVFSFQTETPADFRPGQYALLRLPAVHGLRAYSMSNLPNAQGLWQFIVKRMPGGQGSALLFDGLQPGHEFDLDGPYGHAWLRSDTPRDIVCVGGGSGLSPLLSILRSAVREPALEGRRLHLFYGARRVADHCLPSIFEREPELTRVTPVLSISEPDDAAWAGERGFVHEAVLRHLAGRLAEHDFYFCGPPPMTDALHRALLVDHRVPSAQLHFDRFH